jgi:23S rRNA pseudouridine1911/1915/1917 synthase
MSVFFISGPESGKTLLEVLKRRLNLSRAKALDLAREQRVRLDKRFCSDPGQRVRRGQRLEILRPPRKRRETANAKIRYVDPHVVVVDKPAGLTTMRHAQEAAEFGRRAQRFLPATLADLLPTMLTRGKSKSGSVRAVHRLDKDTSGMVVFARNVHAERNLGRQFRGHTIDRRYLAIVRGRAKSEKIESMLVDDRGDGRRGTTTAQGLGKRAVTHVKVLESIGDYSLVECRLETGRTHQVRIHLGERGTPICGERVYDRPIHGKPLPDDSGAPRLALHAARLGFDHPITGKRITWDSPLPKDLQHLLNRLRRLANS